MTMRFPLATATWDQAEYDALQRVIASGNFTMGENVRTFEDAFANFIGSNYAVMVNSGSSANLLMIAALCYRKLGSSLKPGDEVIVPAVSWSTTYYPLHQYGLKLRFVDIDLATLNISMDALENAITDRTKAILAVNLLGNPNDFDRVSQIIGDRDILLLEDNCESLGATFKGRQAGTFGVMGTYSSFFSHHISTMEGGLVVTDDEELYHLMLSLRAHGWTRSLPKHNLVCGEKSDDPFEEAFRFVLPGYNLRPLEMSGALGIEQLKKLPMLVSERRKNAKLLQDRVGDHDKVLIQQEVGESSWFGFSLVPRPGTGLTRDMLRSQLTPKGFEVRPIVAGNFAKNEVVKLFDYDIAGTLENADHIDKQGLFIGNHHYDVSEMIGELEQVLSSL
ncbi:DegT/DnrJ/EryC1/StrS family aminotransferase [Sphingomonas hankookensis]|uniref:DegT/DnrJ/EryC1/StrS family aminotransferase n=1 Tax=Sphingomonas hankookensis TaxID=563996 RepID=UPI001F593897|nr:DegT/DnrJ/EryC1/StrS family aminotransferase [Sphingomonas hankookensis]